MKTIQLPKPQALPATLTDVLAKRRSCRSFTQQGVTDQELANILWCAAGQSSPDGKRTAPSCLNLKAVTVYVLRGDGVWRYDEKTGALEQTSADDVRPASTLQQHAFVDQAPATLVFVMENTPRTAMARPDWCYLDAGTMVQGAYLACEAQGLAGVARGSADWAALGKAMGLPATMVPIFCFTLGHRA